MNSLTVSQGIHSGMTMLSNRFIDEYMRDANDAQIKVYLYLLRCSGTAQATGVATIADHFNFTEKDIVRALQYWDKKRVISLLYDEAGKLAGIRLENLDAKTASDVVSMPSLTAVMPTFAAPSPFSAQMHTAPSTLAAPDTSDAVCTEDKPAYDKSVITLDRVKAFKEQEQSSELIFVAEQYLGRPLSTENIRSIIFMTDALKFSPDLVDHLIQYCVDRGKKDFRYMEKVAISWAEAGVTTPEEAASHSLQYDKEIYTVMNALGRSGAPTKKEASYIRKWIHEYGFSPDMVLEACERCSVATDKHRFEYTDGILQSWRENSVHTLLDIKEADTAFRKKNTAKATHAVVSSNPFHQFRQNQYDYDELLQKVKIN